MTRQQIEAVRCDRCGEAQQFTPSDGDREQWAVLYAVTRADVPVAGSADEPLDLCPPCVDELAAFLKVR